MEFFNIFFLWLTCLFCVIGFTIKLGIQIIFVTTSSLFSGFTTGKHCNESVKNSEIQILLRCRYDLKLQIYMFHFRDVIEQTKTLRTTRAKIYKQNQLYCINEISDLLANALIIHPYCVT
jgi:hypothetical protein